MKRSVSCEKTHFDMEHCNSFSPMKVAKSTSRDKEGDLRHFFTCHLAGPGMAWSASSTLNYCLEEQSGNCNPFNRWKCEFAINNFKIDSECPIESTVQFVHCNPRRSRVTPKCRYYHCNWSKVTDIKSQEASAKLQGCLR